MEILLWLFTLNLGVVCGAGLYEARVVVPIWAGAPPGSLRSIDSGRRFWVFAATIPLSLLTLVSLVLAANGQGVRAQWWLAAALIVLAERIATFAYFVPAILRLQRLDNDAGRARTGFAQWRRWNGLRMIFAWMGWLAATRALSLPG